MKKMKRLAALFLAVVMVLAMGMTAMAAPQVERPVAGADEDGAKITIKNASKDETYNVYKLFDAIIGDETGENKNDAPITYTGEIPSNLTTFFEKDKAGNIRVKEGAASATGEVSGELKEALETWTASGVDPIATAKSNGSELQFVDLPWGYYIVTTSLGAQALTVTSTRPEALVIDKNVTEPFVDPEKGKTLTDDKGEEIEAKDVYIGQTVYYTLRFTASNFEAATKPEEAKRITSYILSDVRTEEFLSDITVESITVKNGAIVENKKTDVPYENLDGSPVTGFTDGKISLDWVDEEGASRYASGAEVVVIYSAKVADTAKIAGDGNTNTFTLQYKVEGEDTPKTPTNSTSSEKISTYALVIQKVDGDLQPLKGATFTVAGLQTASTTDKGVYVVTGMSDTAEPTEMSTDDSGILIIRGVKYKKAGYEVSEKEAPEGFNKLQNSVTANVVKTEEKTTNKTTYFDENGVVTDDVTESYVTYTNENLAASVLPIINNSGAVLPSTGGIGTTIFYVVGGILVLGAGVLLITKKRMSGRS